MQRGRMGQMLGRLRTASSNPMLLSLLLSSVFAVGLLIVRILYSGHITYVFLGWNLFLAWLPYLFGMLAVYASHRRQWLAALISGVLWLVFFPNAPYILTDFLHLDQRWPVPLWYDVILLASFSWTGVFLALNSLSALHSVVTERFSGLAGWLFAFVALALCGLGVYVGRFLRWNSWDVFSNLWGVAGDLAIRLRHPITHRQAYAVSSLFSVFLLMCYLTVRAGRREPGN